MPFQVCGIRFAVSDSRPARLRGSVECSAAGRAVEAPFPDRIPPERILSADGALRRRSGRLVGVLPPFQCEAGEDSFRRGAGTGKGGGRQSPDNQTERALAGVALAGAAARLRPVFGRRPRRLGAIVSRPDSARSERGGGSRRQATESGKSKGEGAQGCPSDMSRYMVRDGMILVGMLRLTLAHSHCQRQWRLRQLPLVPATAVKRMWMELCFYIHSVIRIQIPRHFSSTQPSHRIRVETRSLIRIP